MREIVYLNGEFVDRADAKVSVEDRGYQFADGVYEVIRFHGHRGLRLDEHLVRLGESAAHLRIQGAPDLEQWHGIIATLIEKCGFPDEDSQVNALYIQVTRGAIARNHTFPKSPIPPALVAYFRPAPVYSAEVRNTGVGLLSYPDERWNRCFIKSVCLLPAILAKQAAADAGAFEALLVRENGTVTEGGSTNTYCVIDGTIYTHPKGPHILAGITRQMVLEAAERAGIPVKEEAVTLDRFRKAQEAFISSTTMDIMPVTKLDDQPIGTGQIGPVVQKLVAAFNEILHEEIGRSVSA